MTNVPQNQLLFCTTYNLYAPFIKQVVIGAELLKTVNFSAKVRLFSSHPQSSVKHFSNSLL